MDGMDLFTVKKDPLGKGGLPRIDVRTDSDIAHFMKVIAHNAFKTPAIKYSIIDK
jgi:hypothetical protein